MSEHSSSGPGPNQSHPLTASRESIAAELAGIMEVTALTEAPTTTPQETVPVATKPTLDTLPLHPWAEPDAVLPPPPVDVHQPEKRGEIAVDRATMCINGLRIAIAQRRLDKSVPKARAFQKRHEERVQTTRESGKVARVKADLQSSAAPAEHVPKTHRQMRASSRRTRRFQRGMKGGVDSWNSMDVHHGINERLEAGLPVAREDRRRNRKASRGIKDHQARTKRVIGEMQNTIEGHDSKSKKLAYRATDQRRQAYTAGAHLEYLTQQRQRKLNRLESHQSHTNDRLSELAEFNDSPQLFGSDIARSDLSKAEKAVRTITRKARQGRIDRTRHKLETIKQKGSQTPSPTTPSTVKRAPSSKPKP